MPQVIIIILLFLLTRYIELSNYLMPSCIVQYQEFMIVCVCVCVFASIVHFIIIAIACWQVTDSFFTALALSKLTEWYIIIFEQ